MKDVRLADAVQLAVEIGIILFRAVKKGEESIRENASETTWSPAAYQVVFADEHEQAVERQQTHNST